MANNTNNNRGEGGKFTASSAPATEATENASPLSAILPQDVSEGPDNADAAEESSSGYEAQQGATGHGMVKPVNNNLAQNRQSQNNQQSRTPVAAPNLKITSSEILSDDDADSDDIQRVATKRESAKFLSLKKSLLLAGVVVERTNGTTQVVDVQFSGGTLVLKDIDVARALKKHPLCGDKNSRDTKKLFYIDEFPKWLNTKLEREKKYVTTTEGEYES